MAISVRDLLEPIQKAGYRLTAGREGLGRPVTGIVPLEDVNMVEFLDENDIIYLTGALLKNEQKLGQLIEKANEKNISAVLLTLGKYIEKTPRRIKAFCDDEGIPFFEIRWHMQNPKGIQNISYLISQSENETAELEEALINAIYFPQNPERYVPVMEKYQFLEKESYCVGIMEYFKYNRITGEKRWVMDNFRKIRNYLKEKCPRSFVVAENGYFICIFSGYENQQVRDIIVDMHLKMLNPDPEEHVFLGVGENTKSIRCIYRSFHQACYVSLLKKKSLLEVPVVRFSSLGSYMLFGAVEQPGILESYYQRYLEPVIRYDAIHETDYFELIQRLIENNFHVAETASQMFMHRNSINYKISKIQGILNCNLSNMEDRVRIMESYKIWCILYKEEEIPFK